MTQKHNTMKKFVKFGWEDFQKVRGNRNFALFAMGVTMMGIGITLMLEGRYYRMIEEDMEVVIEPEEVIKSDVLND